MIMNKVVVWAERYLFPPIKILHIIGYFVLFALMFLTVGDVIGRKLAGSISFFNPIPGTFELTEYALIIIVFASLGYTQVRGEHISIDIITSKFPKRGQAILDSFMSLVSLVMFGLVAWQGIVYAGRLTEGQNVSGVLSIPQAPFAYVVAAGSIIYCLAMLVNFFRNIAKAVKHVA
jgi:TRAP-type C4-dicarboxylate transport system permease small subunit